MNLAALLKYRLEPCHYGTELVLITRKNRFPDPIGMDTGLPTLGTFCQFTSGPLRAGLDCSAPSSVLQDTTTLVPEMLDATIGLGST